MKLRIPLLCVLALLVAAPSEAQSTPAKVDQYNRGTKKLKIGAVLMGAGAFLVVTTPGSGTVAAPVTLGTGMGLILWGAKDRANAMKPHTAFGASLGRSKRLYVSRQW